MLITRLLIITLIFFSSHLSHGAIVKYGADGSSVCRAPEVHDINELFFGGVEFKIYCEENNGAVLLVKTTSIENALRMKALIENKESSVILVFEDARLIESDK